MRSRVEVVLEHPCSNAAYIKSLTAISAATLPLKTNPKHLSLPRHRVRHQSAKETSQITVIAVAIAEDLLL